MLKQKALQYSLVIIAVLVLFLISTQISSSEEESDTIWLSINTGSETQPQVNILESDITHTIIETEIYGMNVEEKVEENEIFSLLTLPDYGYINEVGKPQLPVIRAFLTVPSNDVEIEVLSVESSILYNYNIFPFQEPTTDYTETDFSIDNNFYSNDKFYPENIVDVISPGNLRDYRIVQIQINPIHFNPVSKEIKIYQNIKFKLDFGTPNIKPKADYPIPSNYKEIYKKTILNYEDSKDWVWYNDKDFGTDDGLSSSSNRGEYLIITFDAFYNNILPLAQSKIDRYLNVKIVNITEVYSEFPGPSDRAIHNFITYAFNNWELPPTYVLLVGDIAQIPVHYYGGIPSDHYYSCVGDDDIYPDLLVGRISAQNQQEVDLICDKIINYHENPPTGDWETTILLAAHEEGGMLKYEGCKEEIRTNVYLFAPKPPMNWYVDTAYAGRGATKDQVITKINEGRSIVNYRGHGGPTDWASSLIHLTNSDVLALENEDLLPVVYSIACYNNKIDHGSDCIGEAWLKAQNGGAVAHFSASRPSYTIPNHDYDKYIFNATFRDRMEIVGDVCNIADMLLLNQYGTSGMGADNVKMYLLFGDPETEIVTPVNIPPISEIDSPQNNTMYTPDDNIEFDGSSSSDSNLDELTYIWRSDIDGDIGNEVTFTRKLSVGLHRITLRVEDGHGGRDQKQIIIIINSPPIVIIDSPDEGEKYLPTESIGFDASSSFDPENDDCSYLWTSDLDGEIGNTESFSKKLSAGEHIITLEIEDEFGAISQSQINFIVNTPPIAVISLPENEKTFLTIEYISFDATDSSDEDSHPLSYIWTSDINGELGNEMILNKKLTSGEHKITLSVNDGFETDEEYLTISLNTPPTAIIDKPEDGSLYQDKKLIEFDASSSFDPEDELSYTWESDISGIIGYEKKLSNTLSAGVYEIKLLVDDNRGGIDENIITLTVNSHPVAVIDSPVSSLIYQEHESIYFDASSSYDDDYDDLTFKWASSKDGNISTSKKFSKELSKGLHIITLTVDDQKHGIDVIEVTIKVNSPPNAVIDSPNSDIIYLNSQEIEFDASSSEDLDNVELYYLWTSDIDGEIGYSEKFDKKLSCGTHFITLEVSDNRGGKDTKHSTIIVNAQPIAYINSPINGGTYLTTQIILFNGSSCCDEDNDVLTYKWISDIDGEIGNDEIFTKNLGSGDHKIQLKIDDGKGGTDQTEVTIYINTPPNAIIDKPMSESVFLSTQNIEFNAISSSDPEDDLIYYWHSSLDGVIGDEVIFNKELSSGSHIIKLTVDDRRGGIDTKEITIEINTPPKAIIDSPTKGELFEKGEEIIFDGGSSFDNDNEDLNYVWISNIDGELYSGIYNGFREKLSEGEHIIELQVKDERNGIDTTSIEIYVNTPPTAVIDSPIDQSKFTSKDVVIFTATSSNDLDDDQLDFTWVSSIDGNLGNKNMISTDLTVGIHTITLKVEDPYGSTNENSIIVKVTTQEINDGDNSLDDIDKNDDESDIYWITLPIAAIAVCIIFGLAFWQKSKYNWEDEEDYEEWDFEE